MVAYTTLSLWLLAQPLVKEKPAEPASAQAAAYPSLVASQAAGAP
jgi:hypothetical protein